MQMCPCGSTSFNMAGACSCYSFAHAVGGSTHGVMVWLRAPINRLSAAKRRRKHALLLPACMRAPDCLDAPHASMHASIHSSMPPQVARASCL